MRHPLGHALIRLALHCRPASKLSILQGLIRVIRCADHVKWGRQAGKVFEHLRSDFMTDVISTVDDLLAEGMHQDVFDERCISVALVSGNSDTCTLAW